MTKGKKRTREYSKTTFKAHQEAIVEERRQAVEEILIVLGKSQIKFDKLTKLAEQVCLQLGQRRQSCHISTLVRNKHTLEGAETPNPYRILLLNYQLGKYFPKSAGKGIKAEDIQEIRKKSPAVDAYCALKDGEVKNLEGQVRHLDDEVKRLQQVKALPRPGMADGSAAQVDKLVTALKRLVDAAGDFLSIDWKQRAIVDVSHRPPKVVVDSGLLTSFFEALEKSGFKPPEEA